MIPPSGDRLRKLAERFADVAARVEHRSPEQAEAWLAGNLNVTETRGLLMIALVVINANRDRFRH